MSRKRKKRTDQTSGSQVIVVHPPLTGSPEFMAESAPGVTTVVREETSTVVARNAPIAEPVAKATPTAPSHGERALGLDALRGALLLAMTFAMTIPFGAFPTWMYHMQNPPPDGAFAAIAGITWRDLLFPGFLFTMSAAIPITNSLRLGKGMPYPAVVFTAIKRFALLMLFAYIIGHVNPYWTEDYTRRGNLMAIAGFLICWPLFTRKPANWNERTHGIVRMIGWLAVAALLFAGPLLYGARFSLERRDGIIASLAFCSLAATCIWLATRTRPQIRVAIIAAIAAAKLAATTPGWVQDFWAATPAAWLYESWYLELMIIVLAGTIAGDLLLQWMRPRAATEAALEWSPLRLLSIAVVCMAFTPIVLVGLYNRRGDVTAGLAIAVAIAGAFLLLQPTSRRDRTLATLYAWATVWIGLGLLLEPFEGGIKKVPQTLSYLALTAGLSTAWLIAALIITDMVRHGRRLTRPLIEVGQNPLMAYIVFMLFLNHIAYASGVGNLLTATWWQAVLRGLLFTLVAGAIVMAATRRRLFWRA
ncbi:MAG TPA: DUF5009 domain-containing protein [Longimicrobiales bacterium]